MQRETVTLGSSCPYNCTLPERVIRPLMPPGVAHSRDVYGDVQWCASVCSALHAVLFCDHGSLLHVARKLHLSSRDRPQSLQMYLTRFHGWERRNKTASDAR